MEPMENVNATIIRLFVSTDQRNWNAVEQCFATKVVVDYASMNGKPAVSVAPSEIVHSWMSILPGFEFTHHQLGNFITQVDHNEAHVFCYGTATHFLKDDGGNVWTVVGSYDFDLIVENGVWKISMMKFNFKYQDGNLKLVEHALSVLA